MTTFVKTKDCPTSWELLDMASGQLHPHREKKLVQHTAVCDFCSAELEMYVDFPPVFESEEAPPMPEPLRELAESTLTRASVRNAKLEMLLGF